MSKIAELKKQIKELIKQVQELQKELELEEKKTEMEIEYLFKDNERYWLITASGQIESFTWSNQQFDTDRYSQGHLFKTEQEAEKERDRRILLTRFRQFRDKCNGDWKPDFKDYDECKYAINYDWHEEVCYYCEHRCVEQITQLGYFKHKEDAKRAIELFGDEIKRLWVEE